MHAIDLNCDMGEGLSNDAALMPFINSANIACGYHAGDNQTIEQTIRLALQFKVNIGAHPGFNDRNHFGRREMQLSDIEIYELVSEQLHLIKMEADRQGAKLHHVKPHGALYNMAARNREMARTIIHAVKDFDKSLVLYGLSGSYLISEAKAAGLTAMSEGFADRTYTPSGTLTPRSEPGAVINDVDQAAKQALRMMKSQEVIAIDGSVIQIVTDTICIHGDEPDAVELAKKIRKSFSSLS